MAVRKTATRSKRLVTPQSSTGLEIKDSYCRICMQTKPVNNFYETTDPFIDRNGYMSICKDCINDLYIKFFASEGTFEKAILRLCRILNIAFNQSAVQATITHIDKMMDRGKNTETPFGIYKSKVTSFSHLNKGAPLTFVEPGTTVVTDQLDDSEDSYDLKQFWGEGMNVADYEFLEREYSDWRKTHKSDTKAEITLLKEICFKQLEIRKLRLEGKSVDSALTGLQNLMKTASVDPAKANLASAGKTNETFGEFVRMIEEKEPAEVFGDEKLFADFDGIERYMKNYILRPLRNFVLGSRDFNINEEDVNDDDIMDELDGLVEGDAVSSDEEEAGGT